MCCGSQRGRDDAAAEAPEAPTQSALYASAHKEDEHDYEGDDVIRAMLCTHESNERRKTSPVVVVVPLSGRLVLIGDA